jgi:L-fucose mutarotase/ribose pyranase (RbsD/FucU family)
MIKCLNLKSMLFYMGFSFYTNEREAQTVLIYSDQRNFTNIFIERILLIFEFFLNL